MSLPPIFLRGASCFAVLLLSASLSACSTGEDLAELLAPASSRDTEQTASISRPAQPAQQVDMWSQGEKMTQTGDSLVMEGRDLIAEGEARISQGQRMTEEGKRIQAEASGEPAGRNWPRLN